MTDILSSAVQRLRADAGVQSLLPTDLGSDSTYQQGWIFQASGGDVGLHVNPEGSGRAAMVLSLRSGWASPNAHNTMTFPTILVEIYADCTRDQNGMITIRDSEQRCRRVWSAVDAVLHDAANRVHDWPGGVRVAACVRESELDVTAVPQGDGQVRGTSRYAVSLT